MDSYVSQSRGLGLSHPESQAMVYKKVEQPLVHHSSIQAKSAENYGLEVLNEGLGDMCVGSKAQPYNVVRHLRNSIDRQITNIKVIITNLKYDSVAKEGFELFKQNYEGEEFQIPKYKEMLMTFKNTGDKERVRVYEFEKGINFW